MVLAVTVPVAAAADPLAVYRWKSRVVLVVAPSKGHPLVDAQRTQLSGATKGTRERDLVLVVAAGKSPSAKAMRAKFDLGDDDARAMLIGKDGEAKLISRQAISTDKLFSEIDAMPMRCDEMRRQR